jgi:hypothetical protein
VWLETGTFLSIAMVVFVRRAQRDPTPLDTIRVSQPTNLAPSKDNIFDRTLQAVCSIFHDHLFNDKGCMNKLSEVKQQIRSAFSTGVYPGDSNLRNSDESDEPFLLEAEFRGKQDWTKLESAFLDQAPDGFASALSFFSPAAFRFYLPGYLLADLDGELLSADLVFHLTHGLTNGTKDRPINPLRYGEYTWFEYVSDRFRDFSQAEVVAITTYLELKRDTAVTDFERGMIVEALEHYWLERVKFNSHK